MEESHPIESWKALIIVFVILALLLGGIVLFTKFYTPPSARKNLIYNYFEFTYRDGAWRTEWQHDGQIYEITLRYNPREVENISVSGRLNDTFRQQPYYITFDPDEDTTHFKHLALAVGELGLNFVRGLGRQIQIACTKNVSDACIDHPIVTCDDDDKAVVYLRTAEEPRVTLDGNCIIIEGKELELIRAVDRVLYHFYKIMP